MKYSLDDYVKSIIYYTRGEYIEKILTAREAIYYAIYQVRTNKNEYVVKLFTEEHGGDIEEKALYYLRKASYIRVPKVYSVFEKDDEIPYSAVVMEKISDGKIRTYIPAHMRETVKCDIVDNIIYKEQDFDKNSFGEIGREKYSTWQEYYKKRAEEDTVKARELLINSKISIDTYLNVRNKFYNFDKIFGEPIEEATLIHGNFSLDNIFINKDGLVVGLINPHIPMYGDKEYETISLDRRKNDGLDILGEYKRRHNISSNFNEKYDFYYLFDQIERQYSVLKTTLNKKKKKILTISKKNKYE